MGYSSQNDRRPFEHASRSSHHHIVNDAAVKGLLASCWLPAKAEEVDLSGQIVTLVPPTANPIEAVIAVDGGYTEVAVQKEFPSATIAFFQFGALLFKVADLRQVASQAFIAPEDMAKLKSLERIKLALPTKNLRLKDGTSLTQTIRKVIFDFLCAQRIEDSTLIETLAWFVFHQYLGTGRAADLATFHLGQNPHARDEGYDLREGAMEGFTFKCPRTDGVIYLSDVFRFHEVIDEERGAAGVLGYLANVIEHLLIIHFARILLAQQPEALGKVLFIKDGPAGFFGQTARLHEPMRRLARFLWERHDFHLAGLEKSGPFVEHAREIARRMPGGSALIPSNRYIYTHILPGDPASTEPYGRTTNYGHKVICKTRNDQMYVVSLPAPELKLAPVEADLPHFQSILDNVAALRCDMYDSAIIPIALVNKLVSLADHPSSRILQKFATATIAR